MAVSHGERTRREIARDHWKRPLVRLPNKEKIDGYTRASTIGRVLEDEYKLNLWKQRMTALGVALSKTLQLAVTAHADDKEKSDELAETALRGGQGENRAEIGTAVHKLAERYDSGERGFDVPEDYVADLEAYIIATRILRHHVIEEFGVCDELKIGGTPDRVSELLEDMVTPDGKILPAGTLIVVDLKTGSTIDFGHLAFASQIAAYSRCQHYDLSDGETVMRKGQEIPVGKRREWVPGRPVNQRWGLIVHLPAQEGRADLHWVNLTLGWQLASLAVGIREWRNRKDVVVGPVRVPVEDFTVTCAAADSLPELYDAYERAVITGAWNDILAARFRRRREELEAAEAS